MSYVLSWDLILHEHSLSLFNIQSYHDSLLPVIKATKFGVHHPFDTFERNF